jgi:hypothetical protein
METLKESSMSEFSRTFAFEADITANPGEKVTAEIFYREIQYSYSWLGSVNVYFTSAPDVPVDVGSIGGTTIGSQLFRQVYVVQVIDTL